MRRYKDGCPGFIHWPFEDFPFANGAIHAAIVLLPLSALVALVLWIFT